MSEILQDALAYARRGWYMVKARGKVPIGSWDQEATRDPALIERWFGGTNPFNVGVATGPSNLFVVDVDGEEGLASLAKLEAKYGELPPGPRVRTPRGGLHIFFTNEKKFANSQGDHGGLAPKIDTRGVGGFLVLPPSVRSDGRYSWVEDDFSYPNDPPKLPRAWRRAFRALQDGRGDKEDGSVEHRPCDDESAYMSQAWKAEIELFRSVEEGERNSTLNACVFRLAQFINNDHISEKKLRQAFSDLARQKGLRDGEIREVMRSAVTDGRKHTIILDLPEYPRRALNDYGNARRVEDRYQDRLRWDVDNEKWVVCNLELGLWSIRNMKSHAAGLTRTAIERAMAEEIDRHPTKTKDSKSKVSPRAQFVKFMELSMNNRPTSSALEQVKNRRRMQVYHSVFDTNEDILHCPNGVLDLKAFELLQHSPSHYCTISTWTPYVHNAQDDLLDDYFRTFIPNEDLLEYYQMVFGSALQDGNPDRLMVFVKGPTSSGKSTLNELIIRTLGDYAAPFNMSLFRANQDERPRADITQALAKRYLSSPEASSEWRWHADQIKRVTGGDMMSARLPFDKTNTTRVPAFTPFLFTNEVPTIHGQDIALERRILVLPFEHEIKSGMDPHRRKMMLNSEHTRMAMLSWLVEGLQRYREIGLDKRPEAVRAATHKAIVEFSDINEFFEERCHVESALSVSNTGLYEAYFQWCSDNTVLEKDRLTQIMFSKELDRRGYQKRRGSQGGKRIWVRSGLNVRKEWR